MKKQTLNFLASCRYKVLVASITACTTTLVATSVSQASDIDIYQDAKSGDVNRTGFVGDFLFKLGHLT